MTTARVDYGAASSAILAHTDNSGHPQGHWRNPAPDTGWESAARELAEVLRWAVETSDELHEKEAEFNPGVVNTTRGHAALQKFELLLAASEECECHA